MKNKKFWLIIIIIFALINIALIIFFEPITKLGRKIISSESDWYAVHLNNGQVYFAHLDKVSKNEIVLSEVYFIESYQSNDPSSGEPNQLYNLVKRGSDDLTTTDNKLIINRSVVLFWEKLKSSSEIVKLIEKNK